MSNLTGEVNSNSEIVGVVSQNPEIIGVISESLEIIGVVSQGLEIIGVIEPQALNINVEMDIVSGSNGGGTGDMMKATYDTNADGKVDNANNADTLQTYQASTLPVSTPQQIALDLKANLASPGTDMIYNNGLSTTSTYIHLARVYLVGTYNRVYFNCEYSGTGTTSKKANIEAYVYNTDPYSTISSQSYSAAYVNDQLPMIATDYKIVKSACVGSSAIVWDFYVLLSDYGRAYCTTNFSFCEIGMLLINPFPLTKFDILPIAGNTFEFNTQTFTVATIENGVIKTGATGSGSGDMMKATYDTNADGKVDSADSADTLQTYQASTLPVSTPQQTALNLKANAAQSAWIAPILLNGWVNFGSSYATAGYMKDSMGFVHLKGMIKSGTIAQGTQIFNIPAGYRPAQTTYFMVTTNPATCMLYIDMVGNVTVVSGASATDTIINTLPYIAEL